MAPDIQWLVINLDRSITRWQQIEAQGFRLGLRFCRVPAICRATLSPQQLQAARQHRFKRRLSDGELACALSHRKAMQCFLDSGADYCVILEDDALLSDRIKGAVAALAVQHQACRQQWDLLKLDGSRGRRFVHDQVSADLELVEYFFEPPPSAMAVLISRRFASHFLRTVAIPTRPIDEDYKHHWACGFKLKSVHPALARSAQLPSEIGARGKRAPLHLNAYYMLRLMAGLLSHYFQSYRTAKLIRILFHRSVSVA